MNTKPNLVQRANENANSLDEQLSKSMAGCGSTEQHVIEQFTEWLVREAHISLNLSTSILAVFVQTGVYQNIHDWAKEQARLSERPKEMCLREKLGRFYDRRIAFDSGFENGEKQQYGALNAGGPGCAKYGPFCMIFRDEFADENDVVYLPDDSLADRFCPGGNLNTASVLAAVAPHSHRHVLAVIKHLDTIPRTVSTGWAQLVLNDDSYIEAIFWTPITPKDVQEVRIKREDWDSLWDLAFADYGRKLKPADNALVSDVVTIQRARLDGDFVLEVQ